MLKGKVAIVTGGSRGIGAAVARKLASQGADVAVVYTGNAAAAEAVCAECEAMGIAARSYRCNVVDFDEAKETVGRIKADFGTVDILVNNAGITKDGLIAMMKEEQFDDVIAVNLKGAFNMIRHCTGIFIRKRGGAIVNMSSVTGIMGNAGQANYAASKAGLIGLTKSVARELAPRGVTCNAVAPGFIDTDNVCPCGHHFRISARQRIRLLTDRNSFREMDAELQSCDPLEFSGYKAKLETAKLSSNEKEAVLCGTASIGGALALAVSDRVWMLENAVYSVISPEGCASILWKDAAKAADAAANLKLIARDALTLSVIERMISEENLGQTPFYHHLRQLLAAELQKLGANEQLLQQRYLRFRRIGAPEEKGI